jgi:predicted nicotinamide N-methyase
MTGRFVGGDAAGSLGPLAEESVVLPISGHRFTIRHPVDLDRLLDRAADDPEQNLPYWAEIWPSGVALADAILGAPDLVAGRRVLELGCGLGITAIAALMAGAEVTAADYSADALLLCRHNAALNAGREPETIQVNWRALSAALLDREPRGWSVVLAADVLYESRDVEPLRAAVERLIAPGGILWLAEPGRPPARRFREEARAAGWEAASTAHEGPWPDPADAGVVVGVHRLWRGGKAR